MAASQATTRGLTGLMVKGKVLHAGGKYSFASSIDLALVTLANAIDEIRQELCSPAPDISKWSSELYTELENAIGASKLDKKGKKILMDIKNGTGAFKSSKREMEGWKALKNETDRRMVSRRLPAALVIFERAANSMEKGITIPHEPVDIVEDMKRYRLRPSDHPCFHSRKSHELYHWGVWNSAAHRAWFRHVCIGLKDNYLSSFGTLLENFPMPKAPTSAHINAVEKRARVVLDFRRKLADSLIDLHNYRVMPAELARAHDELDQAVDRCYRAEPFENDMSRCRFLFAIYQKNCPSSVPPDAYSYASDDLGKDDR
jgi:hypothetical protein